MSVWKGSQLIAANGSPGNDGIPGPPGRDGINGNGVLVVDTCTEISNNVDAHGASGNTGGNSVNGNQQWCKVGGYRSGLDGSTGQASEVFGYDCHLGTGQGIHVEGNGVSVDMGGQGAHAEGHNNTIGTLGSGSHVEGKNANVTQTSEGSHIEGTHNHVVRANNGVHIEGMSQNINNTAQGVHIEGCFHSGPPENVSLSDGGHIGGIGLNSNSRMVSMPHQIGDYESTYIRLIGTKTGSNTGKVGLALRNDGCMGIAGDLAFTALDSTGNPVGKGRYTLGEIVEALIDAGILNPPT